MYYQFIPYVWALFSSVLVSLTIVGFSWPRRMVPGAKPFIVLMFTSAVWSTANALELMGTDLQTKLFWANIQYVCYNSITVSWLIMALQYTGQERWLNRRRLFLLLIIPILTVALTWTNPWHDLMRRDIYLDTSGPFPVIGKTYGPWFWVYAAYTYPLVLLACLIYIRAMVRMWWHYRWQTLVLLLGVLLPYIVNLAYTLKISPFRYDVAPALFSVCGIFYTWGLFRFELFDRLPATQSMVIQSMGDGMIVFDKSGRVARFNPAAVNIVGSSGNMAGRTITELFGSELDESFQSSLSGGHQDIVLQSNQMSSYYDARWWPIIDQYRQIKGYLLLLHDLTEVKEAQQEAIRQKQFAAMLEERERLARELHDSLGQVMGYMNIQIQAIRDRIREKKVTDADNRLFHLSQVIEESNAEIREYIYGIKTSLLFKDGFFKTLEQYTAHFAAEFNINVMINNQAGLTDRELALPIQAQLFRVIQESFTNVRKHARAGTITIDIERNEENIKIIVGDDGIGFDPAKLTEGKHFGQGIMRERATHVGGDVQIHSVPGTGTEVIITVPSFEQYHTIFSETVSVVLETPERAILEKNRLLLVDDHALFMDGLQNLLVSKGFQVIGTAKDGWEGLEKARIFQPDVILMDIQMPGCDGLMATRLIKAELPKIKIAILTMSDREKDLFEAIKSGASGYLLKGLGAEELVKALKDIIRGESTLSAELAAMVLEEFSGEDGLKQAYNDVATTKNTPDLTPRQAEILVLVAQGWTYREIGQKLFLSESTIKFHMREILERLHLKRRSEVEAYARKVGLKAIL